MRKITIKEKDYLDLVQKEKDLEQYFQESIRLGQENVALQTSDRVFPDLSDALEAYVTGSRVQHEFEVGRSKFSVLSTKTMHLPNGETKVAAVVLFPKDFFSNDFPEGLKNLMNQFGGAKSIFEQPIKTKEGLEDVNNVPSGQFVTEKIYGGNIPTNDTQGADDPDDIKNLFHPAQ